MAIAPAPGSAEVIDAAEDGETLRLLEFPEVLSELARWAVTAMGRERCLALRPMRDLERVALAVEQTSQARQLLDEGGSRAAVPLDIPDVRAQVGRAQAGGILAGPELAAVRRALDGLVRLRAYLLAQAGLAPRFIPPYLARIADFKELAARLSAAIGEEGEVLDSASSELAAIRNRRRRAEVRAREALDRLVRSAVGRKALQEPVVTLRAGRYVVPVREAYREMVPGIVHDVSASGATLFVEPLAALEANNTVRAEMAREQAEVERILRELSGNVQGRGAEILEGLQAAGGVDAVFARARYGQALGATAPALNRDGRVVLHSARHPLLRGTVVPIDIAVGGEFSVLVITGPNTGGKTVALKTVGLLTLMAMAGLHVPAEAGSEVAVFDQVWADVGDQQSVAASLSTFSSHVRRLVPVLQGGTSQMLVLLDELGAGTDPDEGAALGCAVLERLRALGARVVVTTHLGALKVLAHETPGMANASVAFDARTLQPTYHLVIGAPGPSQALTIAGRLGVPPEVLDRARQYLGADRLRADTLIAQLQAALAQARQDAAVAARERQEAQRQAQVLRERVEQIRLHRHEAIERARRRAEALLEAARREADQLVGQARRAAREQDVQRVVALRARLAAVSAAVSEAAIGGSRAAAGVAAGEAPPGSMVPGVDVRPGQPVWVVPLGAAGRVVEVGGAPAGEAVVQVGGLRTRLPLSALRVQAMVEDATAPGESGGPAAGGVGASGAAQAVGRMAGASGEVPGTAGLTLARAAHISPEIDLRGQRVDEALLALDKYLDDCVLAGLRRVRIIHGKGTGALRQAIRDELGARPAVARWNPGDPGEGGDGVTVAELA